MTPAITIRPATKADLPALGVLGAMLVRTHYQFDPKRFMAPGDRPEEGYAWFLGTQLREEGTAVLVAEDESHRVVGYVYTAIEPQSWQELREECGVIHDVAVDAAARGRGVATALVEAAISWLSDRGMPRVVLSSAAPNVTAQRVFERLGFRRTMVEMTREL